MNPIKRLIRGHTRRHARQVAVGLLQHLPAFLMLLLGLIRDARVPRIERGLLLLALAYLLTPADFLPDMLGVLGFVDDLYLLGLAIARLFARAGPDLLLDHWRGDPHTLGFLVEGVDQLGDALPPQVRRAVRSLFDAGSRVVRRGARR